MGCFLVSVCIFSQLRSRSQSREGEEQLEEVREEEEAGVGGGHEGRKGSKEGTVHEGKKGSGAEADSDKEQQDELEQEEELQQRSISETDLR